MIPRTCIYNKDIFMVFIFGKISLSVDPLWTGLISTQFSLAGSKHNLTFPLGLSMRTKLLHYSAVSFIPSGGMMSCCCSLSNSSLNSFCSAYVMHLRGVWYGLVSGFSCKENILSKHPLPLKTSLKSLYSCFVISALALLLLS